MSIFVQIAGQKLYIGLMVSDLQPLSVAQMAAMQVYELQEFENTHVLADPVPTIDHRIEERSTATFDILDMEEHHSFEYGQEVLIRDEQGRLFGGLIEEATVVRISPSEGGLRHSIQCIDYHALADRRQFHAAYESETGGNIVRDILEILAEEGVTEGEIQPGELLENILFNYITCSEALDKAAELCGYTWFIDEFKRLYFIDRATYAADWGIQDGSEILEDSVSVVNGNPEYRNVQYIQGGQAETSQQTESFVGDGTQKSFTVGYPLARVPTIYLNGELQTVGIKGIETDRDWYWNKGDATITQDQSATPISSSDVLTVQYTGAYKLIVKASQAAEITRQKVVQGFGSGKVEKTYSDSSLLTQDAALVSAKAKLLHYAKIGRKLQYSTLQPGLAAGVLQTVSLPVLGIDGSDMLITAVRITFDGGLTKYAIEAVEGPVEESWEMLFCGLAEEARRQQKESVGESDTVQGLEEFTKTWLASEHPNPFIRVYPGCTPSDIDFPCLATADRLSYVVLYSNNIEFFRKPIALQTESDDGTEIYTTCIILSQEANGVPIDAVALWGGDGCSMTPGSGIEMQKHSYSKTKNSLESLQLDFVSVKGWA